MFEALTHNALRREPLTLLCVRGGGVVKQRWLISNTPGTPRTIRRSRFQCSNFLRIDTPTFRLGTSKPDSLVVASPGAGATSAFWARSYCGFSVRGWQCDPHSELLVGLASCGPFKVRGFCFPPSRSRASATELRRQQATDFRAVHTGLRCEFNTALLLPRP